MTERETLITEPDLITTPPIPTSDSHLTTEDTSIMLPTADFIPDPFYTMLGESLEGADITFPVVSPDFVAGKILINTDGFTTIDQISDLTVVMEPLNSAPKPHGSLIFESLTINSTEENPQENNVEDDSGIEQPVYVFNDATTQVDIEHAQTQRRLKALTEPPTDSNSTRKIFETAGEKIYDKIGRLLLSKIGQDSRKLDEIIEEISRRFKDLSDTEVQQIVLTYVEAGFFSVTKKGNIKRTDRVEGLDTLGSSEIRSAIIAHDAMQVDQTPDQRRIKSIKDIKEAYKKRKKDYVDKLTLETEGNRVLYVSEILMGNNATDVDYLARVIKAIKKLPDNMKPNTIVVSGLLEGSHKFRNKDRRLGLQLNLGEQFEAAKVILDEFRELGVPVIYVMSNDDREIAHDGTIETMRIMENLQRPLADSKKQFIPYYQIDQMKQGEAWDTHKRFQLEVAFEYSLRTGRRLRSADEIADLTGGRIRMEEYLLLWEAHQALINGDNVPDYISKIIDINSIPVPGKERNDLIVTDGMDLTLKKEGVRENGITTMIRESLSFGDKPLYQDPTVAAEAIYKQLLSNGRDVPDQVVILDQQQQFGIGTRTGWVTSAGGMIDSSFALKLKTSIARAGQGPAWRGITTRRQLLIPSTVISEMGRDGFDVTFLNRTLLDKADASSERFAIALFNDWQQGSPTARADLQVKWADFVMSRVMQEYLVDILTDGDLIQGAIFKGTDQENVLTGLVRVEDQLKFTRLMIQRAAYHLSPDDFRNLLAVDVAQGNHETDTSHRSNGTSYADTIAGIFRELVLSKGFDPKEAEEKVKAYERFTTSAGDYLQAFTAILNRGGYGIVAQHKIVEKGGKGQSAKAPVYQASGVFEGLGEDGENMDFGLFAHWHHPQYGVFGDKVGLVAPSIAGLSGFEWNRTYKPVMGGLILLLGGGLPPQARFYNKQFLDRWKIKDGEFSEKSLRKAGFKDDRHYDPAKHGYHDRKDGLSKALWALTDEVVHKPHSSF